MTRFTLALLALAATAAPALGQQRAAGSQPDSATRAAIVTLEKQAWTAWKSKDTAFFRAALPDDAISNGREGVSTKDEIVRGILACDVTSFSFDEGSVRLSMVDANTALLTFKATQDFTCGGTPGPSPVWATSLYVRRGGQWQNVFYQETPAVP